MKAAFTFATLTLVACGPAQDLGPAVTCADMTFDNNGTDCSFVEPSICSDGNSYEINCEDDSTCTCTANGLIESSIIASHSPSGFCASENVSSLHDVAAKCGWNLNP